MFIWLNGKFIDSSKATVPILNHSLHYGSAVFEGIRCYDTADGPAIFRLKDHIDRLFYSAKTIGMEVPYSKGDILEATKVLIKKNKLKECYIRPIIFYGEKMGLLPVGAPVHFAIAAWSWGKYLEKDSVSIKISPYVRIHPQSSVMGAKISGHYSNSIIAALDAKKSGFDEALLLDYKGNIAEGPGENIFFVKGKKVFTPKRDSILPGLTRDSVIRILKDKKFAVVEKNIRPAEIKNFEEAFFTGTAVEINAIGKIDNKLIGKGNIGTVAKDIKESYADIVRGKIPKYRKWLDFINV
ncbi:branched-chain amino acid transaminase [Candidatus Parcubacteria bacterium]|nr:branched-chain amino acid transaminase [Patescibacteria group bacterium]MBU4309828.1 branched-chain amino acid transaminase [Patescibacteria group bacterium]MBU4432576.1 branched-chain amino acid transaminase [Patescibacteria group bacterium]MBU4578167.1 branched-chain amino acid transaminase [Patescibacteria group bacterium]MCG2696704.1 branched-chain amino acid transaminase [Candidatus Parcubacteria bacterium]